MYIRSYLQSGRLTITLSGDIDHHEAQQALKTISEKIESYSPHICVLDFQEVSFMDSSGIAIVIFCVRRMRELGGELALSNVQQQPMRVFDAAGIRQIAEIREGESS